MSRGFRDPRRKMTDNFIDDECQLENNSPRSVSEVTRDIKTTLEGYIGRVWIEGEISNFSAPRSGHYYFTLKDSHSAISCVMWRSSVAKLGFTPEDGLHIETRGKIAVYEPQGRYQIVCDSVKSVKEGDLQTQFEALKQKLQDEGLFSPIHKKDIPDFPTTIGIVTSSTGAAVQDIIRILKRRMPGINIIVSPCKVQGVGSKEDIVNALQALDDSKLCDVIIVGRGGGSLEDLWAFNEEIVARAIWNASTPIVSAVGHETDFSISDIVADLRAATPSEAAEIVVSDSLELNNQLNNFLQRLNNALMKQIEISQLKLKSLAEKQVLQDPMTMIMMKEQVIDNLEEQLHRAQKNKIESLESKLSMSAAKLQALSPLNVMARGFSVTWLPEKRKLVRKASEVTINDIVETKLTEGSFISKVIEKG